MPGYIDASLPRRKPKKQIWFDREDTRYVEWNPDEPLLEDVARPRKLRKGERALSLTWRRLAAVPRYGKSERALDGGIKITDVTAPYSERWPSDWTRYLQGRDFRWWLSIEYQIFPGAATRDLLADNGLPIARAWGSQITATSDRPHAPDEAERARLFLQLQSLADRQRMNGAIILSMGLHTARRARAKRRDYKAEYKRRKQIQALRKRASEGRRSGKRDYKAEYALRRKRKRK